MLRNLLEKLEFFVKKTGGSIASGQAT